MFLKCRVELVIDDHLYSNVKELVAEASSFIDNSRKTYNEEDDDDILFLKTLPVNTVFCKDIKSNKKYICLPFFSSHIQLSIKPCEHVWVYPYKEENTKVNGYWIARPHSLNYTEDTTYNFSDRDSVVQYNYKILNKNKITNDINMIEVFSDVFDEYENKTIDDNYQFTQFNKSNNHIENFFPSKHEDVTIRGSRNNVLNLGYNETNSSSIKIIAGIGSRVPNFPSFEDALVIDNEDTKVLKGKYLSRYNNIPIVNDKRSQSNKNISFFTNNESIMSSGQSLPNTRLSLSKLYNKRQDASKIEVFEQSSNNELYTLFDISLSTSIKSYSTRNFDLYKKSKTKYQELNVSKQTKSNNLHPTINLVSNNINLVSLDEGEINITKKFSNVKVHDNSVSLESSNINLESDSVFIGKDNFQNAVKGQTLKAVIKELIEIQKETLKVINRTVVEIKNHNHEIWSDTPIPTTGPYPGNSVPPFILQSDTPFVTSEYTDIDNKTNTESQLITQLNNIETSLDNILSRITHIS